jgi:hypothetical protein
MKTCSALVAVLLTDVDWLVFEIETKIVSLAKSMYTSRHISSKSEALQSFLDCPNGIVGGMQLLLMLLLRDEHVPFCSRDEIVSSVNMAKSCAVAI